MLRLPSSVFSRRSDRKETTKSSTSSKKSSLTSGASYGAGFPLQEDVTGSKTLGRKNFIFGHANSVRFEDAYSSRTEVGIGGFGSVRRVTLKGARSIVRAAKSVGRNDLTAEESVRREIAILKHLDHPNICRVLESYEDKGKMYIILEFIDGYELFDIIVEKKMLDERIASGIMRQVFSALQYCHERKVIHRDLKPENIMVHRSKEAGVTDMSDIVKSSVGVPEIKLIDFGLAWLCESRQVLGDVVGSHDYLSPEARAGRFVFASDMYSVGVVLHAMLAGCLPSLAERAGEKPIAEGGVWDSVTPDGADLVRLLVIKEVGKRLTAADAAKHKWIKREYAVPAQTEQVSRMMADFLSFHRSAQLRRAALTALAMHLTQDQVKEHRERFNAIDRDGNGTISREELMASIKDCSPLSSDEVDSFIDSVFDSIDSNGSQEIDYTEWLAAAVSEGARMTHAAMLAAFRVFDANRDGQIDKQEFAKVLGIGAQEVQPMIDDFDFDGDGLLNFTEFTHLVSKHGSEMTSVPSAESASKQTLCIDELAAEICRDRDTARPGDCQKLLVAL